MRLTADISTITVETAAHKGREVKHFFGFLAKCEEKREKVFKNVILTFTMNYY